MFTGLIEEVGHVDRCIQSGQTMKLIIRCHKVLTDTKVGDSIAINGVCLTVTEINQQLLTFDVMPETMKFTNFNQLYPSSPVNLERAMAANGRFGGHLVQGHVDGIGILQEKRPVENAILFRFQIQEQLTNWMVIKGSIAINGISLTLTDVQKNSCSVSLIPHTLTETQMNDVQIGDQVNIECDLVGKYISKWAMPSSLSIDKLKQAGFC